MPRRYIFAAPIDESVWAKGGVGWELGGTYERGKIDSDSLVATGLYYEREGYEFKNLHPREMTYDQFFSWGMDRVGDVYPHFEWMVSEGEMRLGLDNELDRLYQLVGDICKEPFFWNENILELLPEGEKQGASFVVGAGAENDASTEKISQAEAAKIFNFSANPNMRQSIFLHFKSMKDAMAISEHPSICAKDRFVSTGYSEFENSLSLLRRAWYSAFRTINPAGYQKTLLGNFCPSGQTKSPRCE